MIEADGMEGEELGAGLTWRSPQMLSSSVRECEGFVPSPTSPALWRGGPLPMCVSDEKREGKEGG